MIAKAANVDTTSRCGSALWFPIVDDLESSNKRKGYREGRYSPKNSYADKKGLGERGRDHAQVVDYKIDTSTSSIRILKEVRIMVKSN